MARRVIVAMSGGVDSSVAAARLAREGWDVVGVTLHLWDYPDDGSVRGRCCAPEDVHDARRVSDMLGIPHYAFDRRALFRETVVDPFVSDYLEGRTPSPCVRCNRGVKIAELISIADRLGAEKVATGHYARLSMSDTGLTTLWRSEDRAKDQSYFLHALAPDVLRRMLFPLGQLTKQAVRREAIELQLPGANKGESLELCFVPTGRYDAFVADRAGTRSRPGPIVDADGRAVGTHDGIFRFTVGQRRHLGVAVGHRAYVTGLDAASATVQLGSREALLRGETRVIETSLAPDVSLPLRCEAVVRYRARPAPAVVDAEGAGWRVRFAHPIAAVVPGQALVLYAGDRVLGGGIIAAPSSSRVGIAQTKRFGSNPA